MGFNFPKMLRFQLFTATYNVRHICLTKHFINKLDSDIVLQLPHLRIHRI